MYRGRRSMPGSSCQEIIRRYYHAHGGSCLRRRQGRGDLQTGTDHAAGAYHLPGPQRHRTGPWNAHRRPALRLPPSNCPMVPSSPERPPNFLVPCSAMLLNALKELAGIPHDLHVISPESLTPICLLKTRYLGSKNPRLHMDEVLIALSATAASDDTARKVLEQLPRLAQCQGS